MYKTFIFILKLIWENTLKTRFKIAILNSFLIWVSLFFTPFFLAKFIKNLENNDLAIKLLMFFIAFSFLRVITNFVYRRYFERLDNNIELNFQVNYFLKLYNQSFSWHLNNSTPYITSVIKKVARHLRTFIGKILRKYIPYFVWVVLFFVYSLNISIYLLLYFLLFTSLILIIIRKTYNKRMDLINDAVRKWSFFDKVFLDFLYNIKTLKKLFIKSYAEKSIKKSKEKIYNVDVKLWVYNSFQWFIADTMVFLMFIIPISYYFYFAIINFGQWFDIIIVIYWVMWIFSQFIKEFLELLRHTASSKWDIELLKEKMKFFEKNNFWIKNFKKWNKITFNNTKHTYKKDKKTFVHYIENLEINKREKIAIIWKSGSGKTTFLNLFTNNIYPQKWEIKIDNINYREISNKFFEQNLTYISQDIELFDMSLKDNIVLGKRVKKEELLRILKWVGLWDFLKRIENDLDILVWEKGIKLSAWERQRINIARWLILKRDMIVLDEVTANLDKKTIKQVWKFIFNECKNKTIIVVSHEDQVLDYVNKIIEFKNWKIKD